MRIEKRKKRKKRKKRNIEESYLTVDISAVDSLI